MENRKNELIKEIQKLKKEFSDNQDVHINYYHMIYDAREFIINYEELLSKKERNQTKITAYTILEITLILTIIAMIITLNVTLPFTEMLSLGLLAFGGVISFEIINEIINEKKENKELKKEIDENKLKYEEQKSLITTYNKEQDILSNYNIYDLLPRIKAKETELFQLNQNIEIEDLQKEVKPIIEKAYQFPNDIELDTDTSEKNKSKTLVKKRISPKE